MNKAPKESGERKTSDLLAMIDAVLADNPTLTGRFIDDVKGLRREAEEFCAGGDFDGARRCVERAVSIVKTGAAAPE